MKKIFFIYIGMLYFINISPAQLNKLCPIYSTVYDMQKVKGMNLLLNTKNFTPMLNPKEKTGTTSSVQLISAAHPFPPLWFQMGNPDTDSGGIFETTFLSDIKIQNNYGNLTFSSSYPGKFLGVISFDTATLKPVDTLSIYITNSTVDIKEYINLHDYQIDKSGNKLFTNLVIRKIDARCLSGIESDSVRMAMVNDIVILNKQDSVVFYWNILEHFSPCEMIWNYRNESLLFGDSINWSHSNSIRFSNDGNILYSFRHIGVGKINRKTGEVMWKLGGKDTLNSIPIPDTSGYYLQHNFSQIKNGNYTLFSNGDKNHPYLEGLIYKIDDEKMKAVLINRYKPQPEILSKALGGYDCKGDTCVICFGFYYPNIKDKHVIAQILINNKPVAELSDHSSNFSYQVLQTKWSAIQHRPKIILQKGTLYSAAIYDLHDFTWYKIDLDEAIAVGTGNNYTPEISGSYVIEAQQGSGIFKSFLISDVFIFKK